MKANSNQIRLGILGVSHGHPYSMSAFFNSYRREPLQEAYPNIERYLEAAPPELQQIPGARVEWIWAENPEVARHVAWVCHIPNVAVNPDELIGKVDAVLVTENAGDTHLLSCGGIFPSSSTSPWPADGKMSGQSGSWLGMPIRS